MDSGNGIRAAAAAGPRALPNPAFPPPEPLAPAAQVAADYAEVLDVLLARLPC